MRTILKAALIMFIFLSGMVYAQDWAEVNPEMNNIVTDTALVRATIATIEPGQKSNFHTHPASFFYAITDCELKVHYEDGQTVIFELKAGDSGYGNPEKRHQTENIGQKTAKFLLVELKEHPYIDESTHNK